MGGLFGGGSKSQPQVVYRDPPAAAAAPAPAVQPNEQLAQPVGGEDYLKAKQKKTSAGLTGETTSGPLGGTTLLGG